MWRGGEENRQGEKLGNKKKKEEMKWAEKKRVEARRE